MKSPKLSQYCDRCLILTIGQLPNPDCMYCLGAGSDKPLTDEQGALIL